MLFQKRNNHPATNRPARRGFPSKHRSASNGAFLRLRTDVQLGFEPLEDRRLLSTQGIDQWWATVGDDPLYPTLTVELPFTGDYKLSLNSGESDWKLIRDDPNVTPAVVITPPDGSHHSTSFDLDQDMADLGPLSAGVHQFEVGPINVPQRATIDPLSFRVDGTASGSGNPFSFEIDTQFVADHADETIGRNYLVKIGNETTNFTDVNELVGFFAPVLHFDDGRPGENDPERFAAPLSVADTLGNAQPHGFNGAADAYLALSTPYGDPSYSTSTANPEKAIYSSVLELEQVRGDLIQNQSNELAINYYFHFPRSNWKDHGGANTHEGDWEGVTLFMEEVLEDVNGNLTEVWVPDRAALSQHTKWGQGWLDFIDILDGGEIVSWDELSLLPVNGGVRPEVYVGLGGHASYPNAEVTDWYVIDEFHDEFHEGDGESFVPTATEVNYLPRVGDSFASSELDWLRYPGLWGIPSLADGDVDVLGLPIGQGNAGPQGPVFADFGFGAGQRWLDPWKWSEGFDSIVQFHAGILRIQTGALVPFFESLVQVGVLTEPLPGINQSINELLQIPDIIELTFARPLTDYLIIDETPTVAELLEMLGDVDLSIGNLTAAIDPTRLVGGLFNTDSGQELRFDVVITAARGLSELIDLGPAQVVKKLNFDASAAMDVTATMDLDFSFGLDLDHQLSSADAFFIRVNSLTFGADVEADDLNFEGSLGFLSLGVEGGSISLHPQVDVDFLPGQITATDMVSLPIGSLVNFITPVAPLAIDLPLVASIGGVSMTPGVTPRISLMDDDLFSGPPPEPEFLDFDELLNFSNLGPYDVLALLNQLSAWLDNFRGTSVFATEIPFTRSTTLGDLLDLEQAFVSNLTSLVTDETGAPRFATAQDLADELALILGLEPSTIASSYDPASNELTYHVALTHQFDPGVVPVDFGFELGSLAEVSTGSVARLDAQAGLDFTFGVDLSPPTAVLLATSAAPANGQLSQDAHYSLSINGGDLIPVTVRSDATVGEANGGDLGTNPNLTLADLVEDINGALADAQIGEVVVARHENGKITLATSRIGLSASLGMTAALDDPAVIELGFETDQLDQDRAAEHFFIRDASLSATAGLSADEIDALARFGFLGIEIVDGQAAVGGNLSLQLTDPGTVEDDGRIDFTELWGALGNIGSLVAPPTMVGNLPGDQPGETRWVDIELPVRLNPNILGDDHPDNPAITITWDDITDLDTLDLQFNDDMGQLLDLERLSFDDIVQALLNVAD